MILGVWTAIFLFLGFPSGWYRVIAVITGLVIVAVSYKMAQPSADGSQASNIPYVEHRGGESKQTTPTETINSPRL